jgi:hypothetical protein
MPIFVVFVVVVLGPSDRDADMILGDDDDFAWEDCPSRQRRDECLFGTLSAFDMSSREKLTTAIAQVFFVAGAAAAAAAMTPVNTASVNTEQ